MKKKQYILIIIGLLFLSLLIISCYFYPRNVKFKYVVEIAVGKVDHPLIIVSEKKAMEKFLIEIFGEEATKNISIDYSSLDFDKNDYMVSFNRKVLSLKYSPYLSKQNDLCPYLKEKPVIPEYSSKEDESIYVYEIKRKNRYRGVCP